MSIQKYPEPSGAPKLEEDELRDVSLVLTQTVTTLLLTDSSAFSFHSHARKQREQGAHTLNTFPDAGLMKCCIRPFKVLCCEQEMLLFYL